MATGSQQQQQYQTGTNFVHNAEATSQQQQPPQQPQPVSINQQPLPSAFS